MNIIEKLRPLYQTLSRYSGILCVIVIVTVIILSLCLPRQMPAPQSNLARDPHNLAPFLVNQVGTFSNHTINLLTDTNLCHSYLVLTGNGNAVIELPYSPQPTQRSFTVASLPSTQQLADGRNTMTLLTDTLTQHRYLVIDGKGLSIIELPTPAETR